MYVVAFVAFKGKLSNVATDLKININVAHTYQFSIFIYNN